jgi:hypothetical protein
MKFIARLCSVAIGTVLLAASAVHAEQMGDRQDWKVRKLNRLVGETCEEDKSLQPPDNPKCATLTVGGGYITVSDFAVPFPSLHRHDRKKAPITVRVEACIKFEDTAANGAKCQALIDGTAAQPGEASMNVENSGLVPVTDYLTCMTWFGQTAGNYPTDIQVQCKNDAKGDGVTDVDVSRFTTSVLTE